MNSARLVDPSEVNDVATKSETVEFGQASNDLAPKVQLLGFLDELNSRKISGWIWNPKRPDLRIIIDLVDSNARLARTTANRYRSDLAFFGIGDGRYGFEVHFLHEPRGAVRLRLADTGAEFSCISPNPSTAGGPIWIPDGPVELAADLRSRVFDDLLAATRRKPVLSPGVGIDPKPNSVVNLQSYLDRVDDVAIEGWVWNPNQPEQRIALELLDDDALLSTFSADQYRADLKHIGIGDGKHGFSISLADLRFAKGNHALHLRAAGSGIELAGSPFVLTAGRGATPKLPQREQIAIPTALNQRLCPQTRALPHVRRSAIL